MLLRSFKVNNGELEVLEESTTQEGRKLIHKTKFSVDGKEGGILSCYELSIWRMGVGLWRCIL